MSGGYTKDKRLFGLSRSLSVSSLSRNAALQIAFHCDHIRPIRADATVYSTPVRGHRMSRPPSSMCTKSFVGVCVCLNRYFCGFHVRVVGPFRGCLQANNVCRGTHNSRENNPSECECVCLYVSSQMDFVRARPFAFLCVATFSGVVSNG